MTGALGGLPSSIQSEPSNQTISTNLTNTIPDDMHTYTQVNEKVCGDSHDLPPATSTPREPSAFELEHRLNSLTQYVQLLTWLLHVPILIITIPQFII